MCGLSLVEMTIPILLNLEYFFKLLMEADQSIYSDSCNKINVLASSASSGIINFSI